MRTIVLILVVVFMFLAIGCSTLDTPTPIVIPPNVVLDVKKELPRLHPQLPDQFVINEPYFITVTPVVMQEMLDEYNKTGIPFVYQMVTWEDYLELGVAMKAIVKRFKEFSQIMCYYREDLKESICTNKKE